MPKLAAAVPSTLWIALLCAAAGTPLGAGANAISTVSIDQDRIVITVPIAVLGGSDALIARWRDGIDQTWNHGNDGGAFRVCGREVVFNPHFMLRRAPE